ncbi:oxidoreductase [Halotalea alkalilenta]|uniref:oxidoreductase n=1 Tax=Halotalea alkalilenta TaxID=376489 RepID=UPI00048450E7|nr:oxidoreductase [Halotalea alkalilenta]
MSSTRNTWLVTGCSTGLGRALVQVLIERGKQVIATARRPETLDDLVRGADNARVLKLDVTDENEVRTVVAQAEQAFGGIDVLVNNAGYGYISAIEEADEEDYRALFETNVFGLIAMTRAALPGMRQRGHGHVVNVSSVGGVMGNPGSGFYAATKFAVVGFTEALSKEAAHLGIKATVVEPGAFRTDWAGRSLKTPRHPIPAYEETVHARIKGLSQFSGKQSGDPVRAAKAIFAAVESPEPPLHLVLGSDGLRLVRQQLRSLSDELEKWKEQTVSADFQ